MRKRLSQVQVIQIIRNLAVSKLEQFSCKKIFPFLLSSAIISMHVPKSKQKTNEGGRILLIFSSEFVIRLLLKWITKA